MGVVFGREGCQKGGTTYLSGVGSTDPISTTVEGVESETGAEEVR